MKDNILLINVMECIRLAVWLTLYDVEDFHGFGEDNKNRVCAKSWLGFCPIDFGYPFQSDLEHYRDGQLYQLSFR